MSILDIVILVLLILGFLAGFKRGIVKQGVLTFGTILVVVLAFIFKNQLSIILYQKFPFFTVGILENYSVLNILLYELISFFILLSIFGLILGIIVKISGIVERMVRATVILALPSKILGGLLGIIEIYVFLYIVLFIVTLPIFSVSSSKYIKESKLKDRILNNTILISNLSKGINDSVSEIKILLDSKKKLGSEEFNCKALNIFVDNNVVSKDSINYLKKQNKIDSTCKIK